MAALASRIQAARPGKKIDFNEVRASRPRVPIPVEPGSDEGCRIKAL
jgi:hypothetical protein